ncbi:MAG: DUF1566 domain-containing protein [Prevotellaceae bacterium]|jgi:hypothetical protein|nr:DUF1566 domain-containing protein [Prevotellaceae bacterium]
MKTFILLLLLLGNIPLSAQKKKVAVFESFGTSITDDIKQAVVDVIQEGIFNSQQYTVVEREQVEGIMKEFNFQSTGMVDDQQMAKIGQASGADYTCFASITAFGSNFQIACKLLEVETMELKYSKSVRTKRGIDDFGEVLEFVANEMFSGKKFTAAGQPQAQAIACPRCCNDGGAFVNGYISEKDETSASWVEAVKTCENKGDRWYLPTKEELQKIYAVRASITGEGWEKFQVKDYWSASQRNNHEGYAVNFSTGRTEYYAKTFRNVFRCLQLP